MTSNLVNPGDKALSKYRRVRNPEQAAYMREYRKKNPERVMQTRLKYYANVLRRNGYSVVAPVER